MPRIFITSEFFGKFSDEGFKILREAGFEIIDPYGHKFLQPEEIIKYSGEADGFICDLEKITKEVVDASPRLKIVSRRGVGVDSVCVDYCTQKGITVARTLGIVEAPVAELVMGYILELSRNISKMSKKLHSGIWDKIECHSIDKKTLGLVGMGKIAYETARRAMAFNMEIVYCDINQSTIAETDFGAKRLDFNELLAVSDFVSVHTPLTEETNGMLCYQSICKMKPSACLINTARGAIVNENDLYKAIAEKKIAGAAIDVFDVEPKTDSILNEFENVILTPHIGTFTREIFIDMDIEAAKNIVRGLSV